MSGSVIKSCTCAHSVQDALYGKGRRVHRVGKTEEKCTVCKPVRMKIRMASVASQHLPLHSLPPKSRGPIFGG